MGQLADVSPGLRPHGQGVRDKPLSRDCRQGDEMNTQQTSPDMARQIDRAAGRRLDSILRTLTVAVALLVFGFSAPMVFADHMGNHQRGPAESSEPASPDSSQACGSDIVDDSDST